MWMYFLLGTVLFLGMLGITFLFLPIRVEIDTREGKYRLSWASLLGIRWMTDDNGGHAEMEICGIRRRIGAADFQKLSPTRPQKRTAPFRISPARVYAMVRSFRIKKWKVYLDTGNMALNGQLFPLCYLWGLRTDKKIHVNFLGLNEVVITLQSNLYHMGKVFLRR